MLFEWLSECQSRPPQSSSCGSMSTLRLFFCMLDARHERKWKRWHGRLQWQAIFVTPVTHPSVSKWINGVPSWQNALHNCDNWEEFGMEGGIPANESKHHTSETIEVVTTGSSRSHWWGNAMPDHYGATD